MIIVQITDTHIEEPGSLAYERFDTAANRARRLRRSTV